MDIREEFYYTRQYRNYSLAGVVEPITCSCGEPYYPRLRGGEMMFWCMVDDYWTQPSKGQIETIVKEVKEIEG